MLIITQRFCSTTNLQKRSRLIEGFFVVGFVSFKESLTSDIQIFSELKGIFSERTLSLLLNSINQVPQKKIQTNKLLHYRIIFLLLNVIKVANVLCLSYIIASLAMKCKQLDTGPKQNKIQVLNKKCTCYKMALTRNEC